MCFADTVHPRRGYPGCWSWTPAAQRDVGLSPLPSLGSGGQGPGSGAVAESLQPPASGRGKTFFAPHLGRKALPPGSGEWHCRVAVSAETGFRSPSSAWVDLGVGVIFPGPQAAGFSLGSAGSVSRAQRLRPRKPSCIGVSVAPSRLQKQFPPRLRSTGLPS